MGKRSEYAAKLCAKAIRANQLKVPPTVKAYYTAHPGLLFVWLFLSWAHGFCADYVRSDSTVAQDVNAAVLAAASRAEGGRFCVLFVK
jgi:hypothetical protein